MKAYEYPHKNWTGETLTKDTIGHCKPLALRHLFDLLEWQTRASSRVKQGAI